MTSNFIGKAEEVVVPVLYIDVAKGRIYLIASEDIPTDDRVIVLVGTVVHDAHKPANVGRRQAFYMDEVEVVRGTVELSN